MSLHGGLAGVLIALVLFCRKSSSSSMLRVCDYVACVTPFGLFFGRIANFVNGELWGRVTNVPWAMRFPRNRANGNIVFDGPPRHPSQLYEAGLEGIILFLVLNWMFWRSDARYQPGKLVGTGLVLYGLFRTGLETLRQPDYGLENNWWGLTMGQTLSVPMIIVGIYLFVTAKSRRVRVESIAGQDAGRVSTLPERLARAIALAGPIPISQFMAAANSEYYAGGIPFGRDFVTAPEISQMFGEVVGAWAADLWARAGQPDAAWVELGPGRGTLTADALRVSGKAGWDPGCISSKPAALSAPNKVDASPSANGTMTSRHCQVTVR